MPVAAPVPASPTKCSLPMLLENKEAPTCGSTDHVLNVCSQHSGYLIYRKKDLIKINVFTCVIKRYHPDNHHDPLLQYRKQIARFSRAMVIRRNFFGINTLVFLRTLAMIWIV